MIPAWHCFQSRRGSPSIVASIADEYRAFVPIGVKGIHTTPGGKKDEAIDKLPAAIVRGRHRKNWILHPSGVASDGFDCHMDKARLL